MQTIEVQETDGQLAQLLRDVEGGETVILQRDGSPVAQVVRLEPPAATVKRRVIDGLGALKGLSRISDDIKTPFAADIEEMYYGNPDKFSDRKRSEP